MKLWILIADAGRARVFSTEGRAVPLREVEGLIHPRSRLKGSAILTSRPGRVRTGLNGRNVTAMPPQTDPKEVEAERFADSLSETLRRAHQRGEFGHLAIAAPPHFLGLLRGRLDGQVRKCLVGCLHKDYSHATPTRSPKLNLALPGPTRSTTPTTW